MVQDHKLPKEMKDALHIYIQRKLEVVLPYQSISLEDCGAKKLEYHSSPTSSLVGESVKGNASGYRENNNGPSFVPRANDTIHQQTISA